MEKETIETLARRLAASVPAGVRSLGSELEQNFQGVLHSALNRMDLVTREEFDVQVSVLARTRRKLEQLEAEVAALEAAERD